ncbi:MAG: DUF4428 domain-containing protein [Clostridia bacterium]|nr:DUF4428 domain-containing protein [Clostridia bacterium]
MGLFDRKYCDICSEKISFLGNRKLEDGNLCKNCARKLSPFFHERRSSTVEEIRSQLEYRKENAKNLEAFHADCVFGEDEKIYLDMKAKKLIITSSSDFREDNPDIIDYSQIIACETEIEDNEEEIFFTDKDGNEKSYNPPRFSHAYEFHVNFTIDSPWFNEISVDFNNGDRPEDRMDEKYAQYLRKTNELVRIILTWKGQNTDHLQYSNHIPGYFDNPDSRYDMAQSVNADAADEEWVCTCGQINKSRFCVQCGKPRDAE